MGCTSRLHDLAVVCLLICIIALSIPLVSTLNDTDISIQLWHHVLYTEPNRHTDELAKISEDEGSLTRTFFSNAHQRAAVMLKHWMEDAGMQSWTDAIGNVHGYINGTDPNAQDVLIGSHYDTVVDAGKYDGSLGVILGIAACKALLLEALHRQGLLDTLLLSQGSSSATWQPSQDAQLAIPAAMVAGLLPSPVHVVGFSDEEGIRFKSTFLGSRALAGTFHKHKQLTVRDSSGQSLGQLLAAMGRDDPHMAVAALALVPDKVKYYVEFHVEQGPVLEAQGVPLGVVVGIAGQTWLSVSVQGTQGHAGTVPMEMRQDPLAAAAEAISMIESTCKGQPVAKLGHEEEADAVLVPTQHLRCTVGRLNVHPGQVNSIPGWANFTVDVRCRSDDFRAATLATIKRRLGLICQRRSVDCTVETTHEANAVHSDPHVIDKLAAAILSSQPLLQRMLPAQGTHDADSLGVHVLVDNQIDPDYTVIILEAPNQPGLLSAITSKLKTLNLDITKATVDGDEQRIRDTFHVLSIANSSGTSGSSSSGAKLTDPAQISGVRSALQVVLHGGSAAPSPLKDQAGTGAADAVGETTPPVACSVEGQQRVPSLLSGAGHDAMAMADITPVGMVFVRSLNGGTSHSAAELSAPADIAAAATAMATFLEADVLDVDKHESLATFGSATKAELEAKEQPRQHHEQRLEQAGSSSTSHDIHQEL